MTILVAEDEKDIRELIRINLEEAEYTALEAKDGMEAWEIIKSHKVDLAILDVMMPRLDGFNLLRKIREISKIPVIFLTARSDDMDKVLGFGLGADDYLIKPFSMVELMARVSAHMRRNHEYMLHERTEEIMIQHGSLVLDLDSCCVYKDGTPIQLNAKEFKLLKHFMENPNKVFTKKQLYNNVWEDDFYYDDNTIMVHISHIRNKIEKNPKQPKLICTIRGIGYKFDPKGGDKV